MAVSVAGYSFECGDIKLSTDSNGIDLSSITFAVSKTPKNIALIFAVSEGAIANLFITDDENPNLNNYD